MKTIPTAEEFAKAWINDLKKDKSGFTTPQLLIEFAKLHVEAALIAAKYNANCYCKYQADILTGECEIDENSILNAYPLTNIK